MKDLYLTQFQAPPDNFTGRIVRPASIIYKIDGKTHRTDGPAIIWLAQWAEENSEFVLNNVILSKENWFGALTEDKKIQALWNIDEWKDL